MASRSPDKSASERIATWLMLLGFALFAGWLTVAAIRELWLLIIVLTS
jgi:uncharacterized membrane protein YgdD (TMEM256/DUF423 family)